MQSVQKGSYSSENIMMQLQGHVSLVGLSGSIPIIKQAKLLKCHKHVKHMNWTEQLCNIAFREGQHELSIKGHLLGPWGR